MTCLAIDGHAVRVVGIVASINLVFKGHILGQERALRVGLIRFRRRALEDDYARFFRSRFLRVELDVARAFSF